MAELLYFKIFVIADIAFSVGFTFSGSRLPGAMINWLKSGTNWAHVRANCSPPNWNRSERMRNIAFEMSSDETYLCKHSTTVGGCLPHFRLAVFQIGHQRVQKYLLILSAVWSGVFCTELNRIRWRDLESFKGLTNHIVKYAQAPLTVGPCSGWI